MANSNHYIVIMAGGVGSRFWPVSRSNYPKQFIDILGTGQTLIQQTFNRFKEICPPENIYFVTNESYRSLIKEQIPEAINDNILGEPVMRNTAPCIAYACHKIAKKNPDACIVVAPSDHLILQEEAFKDAIRESLKLTEANNFLVTLGIVPSRPDTGYGYIQHTSTKVGENFYKVKTFTEKPDLDLAKTFIASGDFLWNAGIFVWNATTILKAFEKHLPEVNEIFAEGKIFLNTSKEQDFIKTAYTRCKNISIDYGVMEKAENVYVRPSDFGWSDLGTWASVYEVKKEKDYVGNVVIDSNKVIMYDSANCIVRTPTDKLVVLQGLDGYIVVESNNVLMICKKSEEQEVKQIVADIKQKYGEKYL
ncbi:sugar phosphate nucleotidyltransferase [Solitalea sp. MAHUQ-68]|uniref:mannose-1-phosphate guanylyltransferase n=1 Tax=Solitalea agri TaxID=2953739 RepID=A0A9X2F405_9SPHI|nr:mannose-1-phosphate guanylyltransferase [Solitalea agri]MCO4291333.1 sugar phosphate nucleotidyltransferase [Solitalea agri]